MIDVRLRLKNEFNVLVVDVKALLWKGVQGYSKV